MVPPVESTDANLAEHSLVPRARARGYAGGEAAHGKVAEQCEGDRLLCVAIYAYVIMVPNQRRRRKFGGR